MPEALAFEPDRQSDDTGVRSRELAATWARLGWAALKDLGEEEVELCQACGRLALDPLLGRHDLAR